MGRYYRRTLYGGAALLTCLILAATTIAVHARMESFVEDQQYLFSAEKNLVDSQIGNAEVRARQRVARYEGAWKMQSVIPVPARRYQQMVRQQGGSVVTESDLTAAPQHVVTTLTQNGELDRLTRLLTLVRDLSPGNLVEMKLTGHSLQSFVYGGKRQFLAASPPFDLSAVLDRNHLADVGSLIMRETAVVDETLRAHAYAPMQASDVIWVSPHDDLIFGERVISYATRLFHDGALFAVFVTNVPLEAFESRFLARSLKPGFVLLAANGEQIAGATLSKERGKTVQAALAKGRTEGDAQGKAHVSSDGGLFVLTQSIAGSGWTLAYLFDDYAIVTGLHGEIALMLALTLGICGALWLGVLLFDRYVFSRVHRDAERALESEHFNRIMLATAPVGLCLLDYRTGRAILDNELAAQYTHDAIGDGQIDTFHERLLAAYRQPLPANASESESKVVSREVTISHNCGRQVHLLVAFAKGRREGQDVLLCGLSDISSRKEAERLLLTAKRSADEANAAKSQFLASMSHEIRTPLHGALGHLELLGLSAIPPAQRELVDTIHQSFTSLLRIINDVLDISKIEAARLHLEHAPINLIDFTEGAVRTFAPLIGKKGVHLFCLIDPAVPDIVLGDAMRVRQILNNLLGNATKFTEFGKIAVRLSVLTVEPDHYWLRLQVVDSGIGIAKHEQEKLFARFTQANGSITRSYGGTGLGLALCKLLSDLMHGHISLASEPGVGSVFTVDLPFDKPAPAGPPAPAMSLLSAPPLQFDAAAGMGSLRVAIVCGATEWRANLVAQFSMWGAQVSAFDTLGALGGLDSHDVATLVLAVSAEVPLPAADTVARFTRRIVISPGGPLRPRQTDGWVEISSLARRGWFDASLGIPCADTAASTADSIAPITPMPAWAAMKILIVEDDAVSRQLLARQLSILGYIDVDTAKDGREALEKCLTQRYELVLSDLSMPGMDGYQLVHALRDSGLTVPVVAVAASEWPDGEQDSTEQAPAIAGFLGKPASIEQLKAVLDKLFRERLAPPQALELSGAKPEAASSATSRAASPDAELYALFLGTVETDFDVLRQAARQNDSEAFLRGLHKLRGALAILGEAALADACGALSEIVKHQPFGRAQEALERFEAALQEAAERMRSHVAAA